ncbi:hypothetical protein G6F35_011658 [Rhizopus arrhizus]|nr:hypothetical protein G6F35_011658 [Rhizopus arrhizus]
MQIHFALNAPPDWLTPELRHVPLVHLTESMEQVCASVTEANNGLLPARPTLAIGQPVAVDPSRAPAGGWILWVQMQELPVRVKGDAAGEIAAPEDGRWNAALREAVADRVQARLEPVMPGLAQRIVGRRSYCPADLEALNCNLVGGDPYSGVCSPDQFFWLRPFAGSQGARAHRTPLSNLFHIGAATHPGPGLGGGSGYLATEGGGLGIYPDGLENFMSGALPSPGVHMLVYGGGARYDTLRGNDGERVPVPGFKVDVNVLAPRLIWVTEQQVMGGQLAFHAIAPLLDVTFKAAGERYRSTGLGDMTLGVALGYHVSPTLHYVPGQELLDRTTRVRA